MRAAIEHLRENGETRVGIVGLSVGGHIAYLAGTELDLPAVVVAYGGWIPTTDIPLSRPEPTLVRTPGITGSLLVLVGEHDHVVPAEDRRATAEALRAAGVRHEFVEYPAHRTAFSTIGAAAFIRDRQLTHGNESSGSSPENCRRRAEQPP